MPQNDRVVNLDLTQFRFPITAIVSITHRVTGVLLFLAFPILLYVLDFSLASEAHYTHVQEEWLQNGFIQFAVWVFLSLLAYHFCAGVRHLLLDFGYFETINGGRYSAFGMLGVTLVLVLLSGVWVW